MIGCGGLLFSVLLFLGLFVPVSMTSEPSDNARPENPVELTEIGKLAQTGWRIQLDIAAHMGGVYAVAWSPDGTQIVAGGNDGGLRIWETISGAERRSMRAHEGPVWSVDWSPDGGRIVSAGEDGMVRVWDARSGALLNTFDTQTDFVSSVAWSHDGMRIAAALSDGIVRVWWASDDWHAVDLRGHESTVNDVAWSYTSGYVVSAGGSGYPDNTVRVWNNGPWVQSHVFWGHQGEVWTVAMSPDGVRIASGGTDRTVRIWNLQTGDALNVFEGHTGVVTAVDWSPTGQYVVSASADGSLRTWDMATASAADVIADAHSGWIGTVRWSVDGRLANGGVDDRVVIWGQ